MLSAPRECRPSRAQPSAERCESNTGRRSTRRTRSSIRMWCRWCSIINPLVARTSLRRKTATFPRMDEFLGTQLGADLPLLPSPHPLPLHLSSLSCSCPWTGILSFYCKSNATPVVFRFGLESAATVCRRTGSGNCVARGSESGCYGRVGVRVLYPGSLCTKRPALFTSQFSFSLGTPPSLWPSLALISSVSAPFHFIFCAPLRLDFVARILFLSLDFTCVQCTTATAITILTLLVVHFPCVSLPLSLCYYIRFRSRWRYASSGGTKRGGS
ncbi:hypothetical protein B0H13DRAFT_993445 [Mycena leptocephala]|nr:hypothetical protein B0H13DRAFT_993445 [Mycena leptocephala]